VNAASAEPAVDRIEILSVDLLKERAHLVASLEKLRRSLVLSRGWHYPLDWTWIVGKVPEGQDVRLLDAGAGIGLLQWYFAQQGCQVASVDRDSRAALPFHLVRKFRVTGHRQIELASLRELLNPFSGRVPQVARAKWFVKSFLGTARSATRAEAEGSVRLFTADLGRLSMFEDGSFDAIYSVSALEHNPAAELAQIVGELIRLLKPHGVLVATLAAARDHDWCHTPSTTWCYSERTLREAFDLGPSCPSNFDEFDTLLDSLRECDQLRQSLPFYYYRSGRNGMPWGRWDPRYQPVGVIKVKD
jgi:SAM-dependent methyltransferase